MTVEFQPYDENRVVVAILKDSTGKIVYWEDMRLSDAWDRALDVQFKREHP